MHDFRDVGAGLRQQGGAGRQALLLAARHPQVRQDHLRALFERQVHGVAQGELKGSRILRQAVRYCAFLPSSYDTTAASKNPQVKDVPRYPVLYSLHGLGDNEQSLMNTGAWSLIQDLREQHKIGEFLIVTPDAARTFYINSRDGHVRYSDFFLQEFMPTIERR